MQEVERFLPIHTLLLQQPLIGGRELLQQLECFLLLEKDEGSSISAAVSDSRADRRRHNMPQGPVLVCPVVCFPSSSVQCASVPVLIRVACCLGLASALGYDLGLTQVPCRGGGSQQGLSPAC